MEEQKNTSIQIDGTTLWHIDFQSIGTLISDCLFHESTLLTKLV